MSPKPSNGNSACKSKVELDFEKFKNNRVQNVKVDLPKVNIRTLALQVGFLSEDVKLYMKLLTSNIYYDLNDRTINLLMEGDIDMSATTSGKAEGVKESDSEVIDLLGVEKEVGFFIPETNMTRVGGAFFTYLNNTIFDLYKHVFFFFFFLFPFF